MFSNLNTIFPFIFNVKKNQIKLSLFIIFTNHITFIKTLNVTLNSILILYLFQVILHCKLNLYIIITYCNLYMHCSFSSSLTRISKFLFFYHQKHWKHCSKISSSSCEADLSKYSSPKPHEFYYFKNKVDKCTSHKAFYSIGRIFL